WLRWWDSQGNLLLTGDERAKLAEQRLEQAQLQLQQERQRAEAERQQAELELQQERQRAEADHQRAERLAEFLRAQGINPEEL
ncbi:MAG: Uma2 family endonuclease, partial [Limnospira sp. PMC 737.11]|nr:Uma2 family endonuclease [Limnospira sp. PMC 737.11]